jgi:hypothetical protein
MPPKPDVDESRGGTRGGRELFKWDSIKSQSHKEREHYLGYSTQLGNQGRTGIWKKNDWWQNTREKTSSINEERKAIQEYEKEIFAEALGQKPRNLLLIKSKLSTDQMKDMFRPKSVGKREETNGKKRKVEGFKTVADGLGFKEGGRSTTWAPSEKKNRNN